MRLFLKAFIRDNLLKKYIRKTEWPKKINRYLVFSASCTKSHVKMIVQSHFVLKAESPFSRLLKVRFRWVFPVGKNKKADFELNHVSVVRLNTLRDCQYSTFCV